MKNKYILIEYTNHSFKTILDIDVEGINIAVECKIDTGCMKTCIPIKRLNVSVAEALRLKQQAIDNNVKYTRTYGVSDTQATRDADEKLVHDGKLLQCTSLRFTQTASKFNIANFEIGKLEIGINYDRTGNILIGMDILSQMDIHIGKSKITGKVILIACPYSSINDEYLLALEEHFSIGTLINAAVVRNI